MSIGFAAFSRRLIHAELQLPHTRPLTNVNAEWIR
jgi:hypothetical protein